MSVGFLEVYNPDDAYRAPGGWACGYLGIPGRSGPCLWGLRREPGSCSCLRGSQPSVAMPVTWPLEFLGKEAIAPELQRGRCLFFSKSTRAWGWSVGSPGIWDYAVPRGHLSPACSPVVPSGGDWALLMAPVGFPRFSQASQGHGTLSGPGGALVAVAAVPPVKVRST